METNADWSPFEGWDLAGFSRTTLSRGEVIVDDYALSGKEGRGQVAAAATGPGPGPGSAGSSIVSPIPVPSPDPASA